MSIGSTMPSNHFILCCPLLLLPSFPVSRLFTSGGQSIGASASATVIPMNIQDWCPLEWTGWISFAVQGTLKSLLQYHSSKVSILRCSVFFPVQLSHPDYVQNIQIGQGRSKERLYRGWLLYLPLRQGELKAKFLAWSLGPSLGFRPHRLRHGSLFCSLITPKCLE